MITRFLRLIFRGVMHLMKPFKLFAYRTRFPALKRFIIEFTAFVDFLMNFLYDQNEVVVLHKKSTGATFFLATG